jgi:uncharacterized protein
MELHYVLLRTAGQHAVLKFFNHFQPYIMPLTKGMIIQGNILKVLYKDKRLSYVDCIGYVIAKRNGVKLLTGDKQLKDLDNVEFVE